MVKFGLRHGLLAAMIAGPWPSFCGAPANTPPQEPALKARISREEVAGSEPIRRVWLRQGQHRFSFIAPSGFRVRLDPTNKSILLWKGDACDLNIHFVEDPSLAKPPSHQKELLRDFLLRTHPSAKLSDEFTCSAGGYSGPAARLVCRESAAKAPRLLRAAWIYFPGGIAEIEFGTTPDSDHDCSPFFNQFLLSFACAAANQPLAVNPISSDL